MAKGREEETENKREGEGLDTERGDRWWEGGVAWGAREGGWVGWGGHGGRPTLGTYQRVHQARCLVMRMPHDDVGQIWNEQNPPPHRCH